MSNRSLLVAGLVAVACATADAHRPIFSDRAATGPGTAVLVHQPGISQVIYREITEEAKEVWLALDAPAGFELFVQIGVPVLERLKNFRPAMAVVGPGLPATEVPFARPNKTGVLVFPTDQIETPRFFHEHFTGTDSWILRSETVRLPMSGRYYVVAYVPSADTGKLWLSIGNKESFGASDWAQFAEWNRKIRRFHEIGRAEPPPSAPVPTQTHFWALLFVPCLQVLLL